jgi:hypothetical protein
VAAGEVHPQPHQMLFGKKKLLFDGRTHQNISRTACLREAAFAASRREKSRTVEPCSTIKLFTQIFFFYEKHGEKFSFFSLEKPVQLIDFTRIVHMDMNNIVFLKN